MADSNTPDSWDSPESTNDVTDIKKLSINARPFVPNPNATAFVPSFLKAASVGETTSQTSTTEKAVEETPASWEDEAADSQDAPAPVDSTDQNKEEEQLENQSTNEEEPSSIEEEKEQSEESKPETSSSTSSKAPPAAQPEEVDPREHINIVFIGHVDAGKSTIGGHLLFLTGQVDKRTLEKYEREAKEKNRESWYFSWALDTNLEERDKGKTVECGRASFDTPNKHFTLLDAPGHKGFVPNMIGGAAQADLGILVISARRGEFETGFERGGQTREHAMLAKTAGVKHLVVLVNKMDDSTVNWDVERYKDIESKLAPFLKKTGFRSNEVVFMPCSGFTGANLKEPVDPSACDWYKGPTFLGYLDSLPAFTRPIDGPLKLLVSDRYKDMGTVVIGKMESGTVVKGETYSLMPNKTAVKILSITGADENEKSSCKAGENVKLKLTGVEEEEVLPGFVLCSPDILCNTGRVFDAQVVILEHKSIICAGYGAVLHIHNAVEEVKLIALIATIDRKSGEKSKQRPRFVKQDTICIARFKTNNVICMETFANFPPMGRFTLRDEGKTIAMGKVLKLIHKSEGN